MLETAGDILTGRTALRSGRGWAMCVLLVAVAAATWGAAWSGAAAAAVAPPPVTFTWSMEKRFGPDRNLDLLANDPHNTFASAHPATHRVTFNGCTITNAVTLTYRWTIDGDVVELPNPICTLTRWLARGQHTVTLRLTGGRETAQAVRVRDIVIVSIGDSAGSGEGAPDVSATLVSAARWQNERCHRSSRAASALTAKAIEDRDPHSSVTFVHLACSGASILERNPDTEKAEGGILAPYEGLVPPLGSAPLAPQLAEVRAILGNRPIDALLVQVGANDLGFGDVVFSCVRQARCDQPADPAVLDPLLAGVVDAGRAGCGVLPFAVPECQAFVTALGAGVAGASAATLFESRIPFLRTGLGVLKGRFALPRSAGGLGVAANHVFLNEYFDPTRGSDGLPCDPAENGFDPNRTLPGFVLEETTFTAEVVVPRLNGVLREAAQGAPAWTRVAGMAADFRRRGYCAADRLVVRMTDSFATQRNENGTIHPNPSGYAVISARMIPAVRAVVGV